MVKKIASLEAEEEKTIFAHEPNTAMKLMGQPLPSSPYSFAKTTSLLYLFPFLLFSPFLLLAQLPPDFYDTPLHTNTFDFAIGITFDTEGHLFVWEKAGKVWVVEPDGKKREQPLLDISEEVSNCKDHGLIGFA